MTLDRGAPSIDSPRNQLERVGDPAEPMCRCRVGLGTSLTDRKTERSDPIHPRQYPRSTVEWCHLAHPRASKTTCHVLPIKIQQTCRIFGITVRDIEIIGQRE